MMPVTRRHGQIAEKIAVFPNYIPIFMYFLSVNNSEKSCPIYIFATMNRNFQIFESFRESLLSISGDIDFSSIGRISELENRFMRRHLIGRFNLSDWRQKKNIAEKNSAGYQRKSRP